MINDTTHDINHRYDAAWPKGDDMTQKHDGRWQPIKSAPRDGTVFIGRNADYPNWGSRAMMRHVVHKVCPETGNRSIEDMGAWLIVNDNDEISVKPQCPHIPFSIAADEYNKSVRYEWMPLPEQDT